eukprot:CAMPEP_0179993516 /NCGR_PEP_ID=MMETSP0984-20121128/6074_1 /TAXON_ID=483367 /ORGANISM="non described non described, Strain CCMP 2436" /LENGTH=113 /DNA_ID=CAMNT_0021912907 /DNA_START=70 /DNA_END=408 /DNA_ORIENTATION=-
MSLAARKSQHSSSQQGSTPLLAAASCTLLASCTLAGRTDGAAHGPQREDTEACPCRCFEASRRDSGSVLEPGGSSDSALAPGSDSALAPGGGSGSALTMPPPVSDSLSLPPLG